MSNYVWERIRDLYNQRDSIKEKEEASIEDKDAMIDGLSRRIRQLEDVINQRDEEIENLKDRLRNGW